MDWMISLRPFRHKEALIPRAPGEWTPICLSAGPSAYLFSFWPAPRHESQKVQGKFTALSIFNIYGEVTSARLPDLAEPSGWTVGQALHLSDITSFPHGHRCNLWAPQRAWALWRVACFSSTGVPAGAGGDFSPWPFAWSQVQQGWELVIIPWAWDWGSPAVLKYCMSTGRLTMLWDDPDGGLRTPL